MIKKQQYAELTIGKCWPINGGDYFDYGHWVGPYSVRRSALATKTLDHLVTQICCTLRFWLHYISTRIKILSLGLMNIHPMKYCSGNVPTQPNLSWLLENAKKTHSNISLISNPGAKVLKSMKIAGQICRLLSTSTRTATATQ